MRSSRVLAAALLLAGWTGAASAHGTGARTLGANAIAVELYYSDGGPMAYAEARVFGPGDTAEMPFVNARSDRLGRVAFLPDRDGEWRIEGRDGEGHSIQATVTVAGGAAPAGGAGGLVRWGLWASLAVNLYVAGTLWAKWRENKADGPRPRVA